MQLRDAVYTKQEIADMLGVSLVTVSNMVRKGVLPSPLPVRLKGAKLVYSKKAVDAFMAKLLGAEEEKKTDIEETGND